MAKTQVVAQLLEDFFVCIPPGRSEYRWPWRHILLLHLSLHTPQQELSFEVWNLIIGTPNYRHCVRLSRRIETRCLLNLPANTGDAVDSGLIPELGRFPGEGNGNPLQYSCLENSMNRGAWRATVHGVAKSQTWPEHTCMTHTGGDGCTMLWIYLIPLNCTFKNSSSDGFCSVYFYHNKKNGIKNYCIWYDPNHIRKLHVKYYEPNRPK